MNHLLFNAVLAVALAGSAGAQPAAPRPVVDSPFFPFTYRAMRDNDQKLAELGYSPFKGFLVGLNLTQNPPYPPDLPGRLQAQATNSAGVLWIKVTWAEQKSPYREPDPALRPVLIARLRELAGLAQAVGWKASIYPHTGDSLFTARQSVAFVREAAHPNLGLTLNLGHELRNRQGAELLTIVDEIKDVLNVVTIQGTVDAVKNPTYDWKLLVQPLGRGDYDVLPLLQKLQRLGYSGPIGLQCFNIEGDPAAILAESMKAWQVLRKQLAEAP
jgi:sugar phosphate isomerase/epimerase